MTVFPQEKKHYHRTLLSPETAADSRVGHKPCENCLCASDRPASGLCHPACAAAGASSRQMAFVHAGLPVPSLRGRCAGKDEKKDQRHPHRRACIRYHLFPRSFCFRTHRRHDALRLSFFLFYRLPGNLRLLLLWAPWEALFSWRPSVFLI